MASGSTVSMKHNSEQRLVHSPDNKACGESAGCLSSRLTPPPDLLPPASGRGQSATFCKNSDPIARSLLDIYSCTNLAKRGGPDEVEEGREAHDGPTDSDGESRCAPLSLGESNSHVIAIASFSGKCHTPREDDDGNATRACSLIEGQRMSAINGAVVVGGMVSLHGERSSPGLVSEDAALLTVETSRNILRGGSEYNDGAGLHEKSGRPKEDALESKLDCTLREGFEDPAPRQGASVPPAEFFEADRTTESRQRSFKREAAEEARTVAAVKRQSLLAGGAAVLVVGCLALACVSPWNIEVASICIVGGLCVCVLGWFAGSLRSRQLLVLHIALLSCHLLMLTVTIALNVHWAVQSFRALRHAYFDPVIPHEEIASAGARRATIAPFTLKSPGTIMCYNARQDTIMSDKVAAAADRIQNFVQPPGSSTRATRAVRSLTRAQRAGNDRATRAHVPSNESLSHLPASESNAEGASTVVQRLGLRRPTHSLESTLHTYTGDSRFLHDTMSLHTLGRRSSQKMDGLAGSRSTAVEAGDDTAPRENTSRTLNCCDTLDTSKNVPPLEPAGGKSVWHACRWSENCSRSCAPSNLTSPVSDLRAPSHVLVHSATLGRRFVTPPRSLEETATGTEIRMPLAMEDKTVNAEPSFQKNPLDTSVVMLLQKKRSHKDSVNQRSRQPLPTRVNSSSMRRIDGLEDGHACRLAIAVARSAGAAALRSPGNTAAALPPTPTIAEDAVYGEGGSSEKRDWRLEEGTVSPEPARCDNLPAGLLKYVYSTRRQLETYGMLCAFSRYDLWGLFDGWSIDCENDCGFKFLATKRYMWSRSSRWEAAAAPVGDELAHQLPQRLVTRRHKAPNTKAGTPSDDCIDKDNVVPPESSVVAMSSDGGKSSSVSYPTLYLRWRAGLSLDKQKKCLDGALNVACSVVKSHYLMLLPPLAVLLVLTSVIVVGVGVVALKSSAHLRDMAEGRR